MNEIKEHYYTDNGRQYMVLGDEEGSSSGYEMQMLFKNRIAIFLPVKEHFANGNTAYEYDYTGFCSLAEYGRRKGLSVKEIDALLAGIEQLRSEIENYMLDVSQVLLNMQYVFINGNEVRFTYYTRKGEDFFVQLKSLWENVLAVLDHSDKSLVMKAYGVYQDILTGIFEPHKYDRNRESEMVVEYSSDTIAQEEVIEEVEVENKKLKAQLRQLTGVSCGVAVYCIMAMNFSMINILSLSATLLTVLCLFGAAVCCGSILALEGRIKALPLTVMEKKPELIDYKITQTDIIQEERRQENDNRTRVLTLNSNSNGMPDKILRLISRDTGQQYEISSFPTVIGTMRDCNIILTGDGISRVHAVLTKEMGELYIEDMGSTNGTWINGKRLEQSKKQRIELGCTIRLALWEYELG